MPGQEALPVEDIVAIEQLAAAYCHLIDAGDGDAFADLFVPTGVFEIVDLVTATGRDELAQNAAVFPAMLPGVRHLVQNIWITADAANPDRAHMRAYLVNISVGDKPAFVQTGQYVDALERTDGGWKFATRTLTLDGPLMS